MQRCSPSGWNRFQPQIIPEQNRETFLWTLISKIWLIFPQSHQNILDTSRTLGSRSFSVTAMLIFFGWKESNNPRPLKGPQMKLNESGFRPPLCTYRLNWARKTSWGWWDEWDDTVLQTQDSKSEPWWSKAEHATSRSRRFPTILSFTRGWRRNIFVSFKPPRPGAEPRSVKGSGANHYPRVPAPGCVDVTASSVVHVLYPAQ